MFPGMFLGCFHVSRHVSRLFLGCFHVSRHVVLPLAQGAHLEELARVEVRAAAADDGRALELDIPAATAKPRCEVGQQGLAKDWRGHGMLVLVIIASL